MARIRGREFGPSKITSIELSNRQALQALEEAFTKGKGAALPPSQLAIFQPIESRSARSGRIIFPARCTLPRRYFSWCSGLPGDYGAHFG